MHRPSLPQEYPCTHFKRPSRFQAYGLHNYSIVKVQFLSQEFGHSLDATPHAQQKSLICGNTQTQVLHFVRRILSIICKNKETFLTKEKPTCYACKCSYVGQTGRNLKRSYQSKVRNIKPNNLQSA
jgi:hypothetical protein